MVWRFRGVAGGRLAQRGADLHGPLQHGIEARGELSRDRDGVNLASSRFLVSARKRACAPEACIEGMVAGSNRPIFPPRPPCSLMKAAVAASTARMIACLRASLKTTTCSSIFVRLALTAAGNGLGLEDGLKYKTVVRELVDAGDVVGVPWRGSMPRDLSSCPVSIASEASYPSPTFSETNLSASPNSPGGAHAGILEESAHHALGVVVALGSLGSEESRRQQERRQEREPDWELRRDSVHDSSGDKDHGPDRS